MPLGLTFSSWTSHVSKELALDSMKTGAGVGFRPTFTGKFRVEEDQTGRDSKLNPVCVFSSRPVELKDSRIQNISGSLVKALPVSYSQDCDLLLLEVDSKRDAIVTNSPPEDTSHPSYWLHITAERILLHLYDSANDALFLRKR